MGWGGDEKQVIDLEWPNLVGRLTVSSSLSVGRSICAVNDTSISGVPLNRIYGNM